MLSGLSSLLFGRGETGDAAVDQTPATCPTPLQQPPNTQDTHDSSVMLDTQEMTDSDWVLVDKAGSEDQRPGQPEASAEPEPCETASPLRHVNEEEEEERGDNRPGPHPSRRAVQQRTTRRAAAHVFRAEPQEDRQLRLRHSTQRQQHARTTKALSRSRLDLGNKARLVRSCGRKPVSAQRRVLQPSGQMNGRQPQRQY